MKLSLCIKLTVCFFCVSNIAHAADQNKAPEVKLSDVIKSAKEGLSDAQYLIGRSVVLGKDIFGEKYTNQTQALKWLDEAIEKKPFWAWDIGSRFILSSPAKAHIYFQKAIRHGYKRATISLASLYATPQISPEGHQLARMFFEAAIAYGEPYGYVGLGFMHENGLGFLKSIDIAVSLYQRAITQGESDGYLFLAELKEKSTHQIDYNLIANLYIEAARLGNPAGVFGFVHLYEKHPEKLNLTHKDIIFWSYAQYFIYPEFKNEIDNSIFDNISPTEIEQIKKEAEALVKSFSAKKQPN